MYKHLIITDPINVFLEDHFKNFIQNPEQYPKILGLDNFLWGKVGVSDLNGEKHIILDTNTGKRLGEFISKSNMFCIVDAEELSRFNPNFYNHIFEPWDTTYLTDFNSDKIYTCRKKDYLDVIGEGDFNFLMRSV